MKCPICNDSCTLVTLASKYVIRGEVVEISTDGYICPYCGSRLQMNGLFWDSAYHAYREYRDRHGLLQPEEIRNLRGNLTMNEFSEKVGLTVNILTLFENGALQRGYQDRLIREACSD